MKTQSAQLNYLKISARKTRLVTDLVKGLPVNEAEAQLLILPNRASKPLLKLLRSAMANAKNNQQLIVDRLIVKDFRVDVGPMQKRWRTRARGAMAEIQKKSCHVTIVLEESEKEIPLKFKFSPKPKKVKTEGKKKVKKEKVSHEENQEKPALEKSEKIRGGKPKKSGVFNKMFRRKTI